MSIGRRIACLLTIAAFCAFGGRRAFAGGAAEEVPCGLAEKGTITVDGLLDDWKGVPGMTRSVGEKGDSGFTVRCNHDADTLYLSVDVIDDHLIRTGSAAADDHLVFGFGGRRLMVYPTDMDAKEKLATRWEGGGAVRVQVADSLQPKGWSVEVGIPLAKVPGWAKGQTALSFRLDFLDADLRSEGKIQATVTTGDTRLAFQEGAELFQQFLDENKLKQGELTLDTMANVDGRPGLERVVAGGKVIGVIGDEYLYLTLPVTAKKDVLEVKVADLGGEGKSSLLVRYVEHGNGGSREILAVYNVLPDGSIARTWAHELVKQMGAGKVTSTWALVPHKKKKGADIVVKPGQAVGFSKDSWNEAPAEDMQPILLPWEGKKSQTWHFKGDEAFGGD